MDSVEIKKLKKFSEGWDYEITEKSRVKLLSYVGKRILTKEFGLGVVDSIQYKEKRRNIGTRWNKKWEVVKVLTTITYRTPDGDLFDDKTCTQEGLYGIQNMEFLQRHLNAYRRIMKQFEILDKEKL
jgi:hypothetical protein